MRYTIIISGAVLLSSKEMVIGELIELLEHAYGSLEWKAEKDAIDVLVQTVLSQNTSDMNSGRAFDLLVSTFGSWEAVASAPVEHIAQAIESGGLSRVKSVRIKEILKRIQEDQGSLSLECLSSMDEAEAKSYLTALPGVGQKTANCVLLFGLGKPFLPVDTHVFRVSRRLGLIDSNVSVERAHSLLQQQIPWTKVYQFHLGMIEHGRRVCHARRPLCNECVLKARCPSSPAENVNTL